MPHQLAADEFGVGGGHRLGEFIPVHPINSHRFPRLRQVQWLVGVFSMVIRPSPEPAPSGSTYVNRAALNFVVAPFTEKVVNAGFKPPMPADAQTKGRAAEGNREPQ